ncbi:MAG: signal peptidase II [Gammaproteobacteria bacterium]
MYFARFAPLSLAFFVTCADQISKFFVLRSALPEEPQILAPFLRLVYAENTGAAFSFLAGRGEWAQWLLRGFSAAACAIILIWLWRRPPRGEGIALALVLGGAAGNLIDRLRFGYVVDFIDAHWGAYHWPAFNIADSAITIGALLLMRQLFFADKNERENK